MYWVEGRSLCSVRCVRAGVTASPAVFKEHLLLRRCEFRASHPGSLVGERSWSEERGVSGKVFEEEGRSQFGGDRQGLGPAWGWPSQVPKDWLAELRHQKELQAYGRRGSHMKDENCLNAKG